MPDNKQPLAFESLDILLSPQEVKLLVEALLFYDNATQDPEQTMEYATFVEELGHYLEGELALFTQEHEARWNNERETRALPSQPHPVSAATVNAVPAYANDLSPPICLKLPALFEAAALIAGAKDGEE